MFHVFVDPKLLVKISRWSKPWFRVARIVHHPMCKTDQPGGCSYLLDESQLTRPWWWWWWWWWWCWRWIPRFPRHSHIYGLHAFPCLLAIHPVAASHRSLRKWECSVAPASKCHGERVNFLGVKHILPYPWRIHETNGIYYIDEWLICFNGKIGSRHHILRWWARDVQSPRKQHSI